ncbi:DUF4846 domain-containing protein [Christensenellaceae bacterium OttesenSCG-928-L17]|nr:DUF4846 domain-containing protein [Christensenellaceae bacterium OttesenSCG-928-L17]
MKRTLLALLVAVLCVNIACAPALQPPQPTTSPAYVYELPEETPAAVRTSAPAEVVREEVYNDHIDPNGETIRERFVALPGFERKEVDAYGEYIRDLPLLADGSPILLYNGEESALNGRHAAVVDMDVGARDLQQCADAALRIRCEYLYAAGAYDAIRYHLTNGFLLSYEEYREGYRLQVDGNSTKMVKRAKEDTSYEAFRAYLDVLFNYASTRSLYKECEQIALEDLRVGDLFIVSGSPGHCVIVMDMLENEKGTRMAIFGQSSMPAQQIHIIQEPMMVTPWVAIDTIRFPFKIAGWEFHEESIRRMP